MVAAATSAHFSYQFPIRMRVPPVLLGQPVASNFVAVTALANATGTAISLLNPSTDYTRIALSVAGGLTQGHAALLQITAFGLPTFILDAEL
jgi:hypothetical protein